MTMPARPAAKAPELAPELAETIRAARAQIERSILEGRLQEDPIRYPLAALSTTLEALHRLFVDGSQTIAENVRLAQKPISDGDLARLENAAVTGADRRAAELARAHHRRTIALAAAILVVAAAGAFLVGQWTADERIADKVNERTVRIQNAAFMAQIAEVNDVNALRAYCLAHPTRQGEAYWKCALPDVWVVAPPGQGVGKRAAAK